MRKCLYTRTRFPWHFCENFPIVFRSPTFKGYGNRLAGVSGEPHCSLEHGACIQTAQPSSGARCVGSGLWSVPWASALERVASQWDQISPVYFLRWRLRFCVLVLFCLYVGFCLVLVLFLYGQHSQWLLWGEGFMGTSSLLSRQVFQNYSEENGLSLR